MSDQAGRARGHNRSRLRIIIAVLLAVIAAALFDAVSGRLGILSFFSPSGPTLAISSPVCGTWEMKPLPFPGALSEFKLSGIAASPSGSLWALGSTSILASEGQLAVARWGNNRWRMIGLPDAVKESAYLAGAHFISDTDGWAVGHALAPGPGLIAMHWDGWNWSLTPTPDVLGALWSVHGISGDDVWAVGWQNHMQPMQEYPLVIHWDGATWQTTTLPLDDTRATLNDVLALSKDDVWAVGRYNEVNAPGPLILHWDGASWQTVPAPVSCSGGYELNSLAASGANDIWAVGSCYDSASDTPQHLTQHWDGTRWTTHEVEGQEEIPGSLLDVTLVSSNDVWAVGVAKSGRTTSHVQHWNGSSWQTVPGPPAKEYPNSEELVAASASELWLLAHNINGHNSSVAKFLRCR
ncbi:MAG TPA: hypothetical protein VF952_10280 [Chloroflexia bacterium]